MRMWIFALVLAGCHPHADCATAVSGAVDRMIDAMPPTIAANLQRVKPDAKRVLTAACVDDGWAAPVIACVDAARNRDELDACNQRLTKPQRDSERTRMDEILKLAVLPVLPDGSAAP